MNIKNMMLVIRHTFLLIFILIAVGFLEVMAKNLMAQEQATEGEPKIQFLKIEPVPNNMVEVGKLRLGKFKEGEPIAETTTLRLVSTTSDSRISQSPMQVKISDVQASGFTPPSDWYDRMTYKLKLADTKLNNVELLSDGSLMVRQLNPKGEIKFQLEFSFPPVSKSLVFQSLMDNQDEITGNFRFTFDYLNISPTANPSSATVYNRIALPPVEFLIVVSRSTTAGVGLIFLMCCGVAALGFFLLRIFRAAPYELELDGQTTRINLSRIIGTPLYTGAGQTVGACRRGLFGGCCIAPRRGMQIDGKEKAKMLPDSGGSVIIDGGEKLGYLSVNVNIQKLGWTRRGKARSKMESDYEYL